MKYGQKLPKEVEERVDAYIERIKAIKWFKPSPDLKKEDVDKMVKASLEAFGVEAGIEYRRLKTKDDWDAAWDDESMDSYWYAAIDDAEDSAEYSVYDHAEYSVYDHAWYYPTVFARRNVAFLANNAARNADWYYSHDAAFEAAYHAAFGATETLVQNLKEYKGNNAFLSLIAIWEAGLFPLKVVDGKFIIYVPPYKQEFPF